MTEKNLNTLKEWRIAYAARHAMETEGKRKAWTLYGVTENSAEPLTDTGTAYIMDAAARMAYTAVKTVYNKMTPVNEGDGWKRQGKDSGSYMLDLMRQAQDDRRRRLYDVTRGDMSHDNNGFAVPTQEIKTHKRQKIHGLLVECIPYDTLELTDDGRKAAQVKTGTTTDFSDCISVATMTLLEMVDDGKIQSFDGVWACRRYVYRAVNKYIMSERKGSAEVQNFHDYCTMVDDDGNDIIYTGKAIDKRLSAASTDDILEALEAAIRSSADKRTNIDQVIATLHLIAKGYNNCEIADKLETSEKQVRRYRAYMANVANSAETKELLYQSI